MQKIHILKILRAPSIQHREYAFNLAYISLNVSYIQAYVLTKCKHELQIPGGSLSHISAHPCAHTSKSAPKWRNAHHQILHP